MLIDPTQLKPILDRLNQAAQGLAGLLAGAPVGQPTRERQVDVLQKVYGEISNYDRHYSTTRSALTALTLTVGLAASAEPIKTLIAAKDPPDVCSAPGFPSIVQQALPFVITLLLFLLAVLVSLYFQRLTRSCQLLEKAVEQKINELITNTTHGQVDPQLNPFVNQITYYQFRKDLSTVRRSLKWPHFDTMSQLLLFGITIFISFVVVMVFRNCSSFQWIWGILILIVPAALTLFLARLMNRRT